MVFRKHFNFFIGVLFLLGLSSCGGKKDKSQANKQEVNPVCSDVDCLTSANWKIYLPGRSFPFKTRVDINGSTVLNECVSKQKYSIDRSADPEVLTLENYIVPKRGYLKIDIVDLGYDCDSETTFFTDNNVDFDFTKNGAIAEIIINL